MIQITETTWVILVDENTNTILFHEMAEPYKEMHSIYTFLTFNNEQDYLTALANYNVQ